MGRRLASVLLGFLYRLVLFPFFTIHGITYAAANQVHWLMTGLTFENLNERSRSDVALREAFARPTRH